MLDLQIEDVAFHGFEPLDASAVGDAIAWRLGESLGRRSIPVGLLKGYDRDRISLPDVRIPPRASARRVGEAVAKAVSAMLDPDDRGPGFPP
jgi:hypothetical protein